MHKWLKSSREHGVLLHGLRAAARPLGAASPLLNPRTQHMFPSARIYQRLSESIAPKLGLCKKYALAAGAPPTQRMITGLVCGRSL